MKFFTTLIATLMLAAGTLSAQLVIVNSPEEVAGSYEFGSATDWGADLLSDVWTADAAFIDDGSAMPTEGCMAATNDLTGFIGLADRGTCNFSLKALNAQEAGAIALIIFNNQPGNGVINLGAGDFAADVTIPVVMLNYEAGQAIRAALEDGPVNISLGDIRFDNNLSVATTDIIAAPLGIIPFSQLTEDFVVTPGATVSNPGLTDASGVTVNTSIEHTPFGGSATEVYSEVNTFSEPLQVDSTSELLTLPSFQPETGAGTYTMNYNITFDSEDEIPEDNSVSTTFTVSENLYSKGGWDPATGNPRYTNAYTISGGGNIEFLTTFNIPNGEGAIIDSVVFYVSTGAETFAGMTVDSYVYEWNDLNEDSTLNNDEIEVVGLATFTFAEDETRTDTVLRLPFLDFLTFEETGVPITENDKDYVIGVRYLGEELVYFGFDESYDYTQYLNLKTANGTLTDLDYGYIGIDAWNDLLPDVDAGFLFTDFRAASATGVILSGLPSSTEDVVGEDVFRMDIFPNPATEQLTTTLQFEEKTSFVEYRITDASGRLIFNQRDMDVFEKEQAQFDVTQLPAGQYFMTIRTQQGIQSKPFVVKR